MNFWKPKKPVLTWLGAVLIFFAAAGPFVLSLCDFFSKSSLAIVASRLLGGNIQTIFIFTLTQAFYTTALVTILSPLLALGLGVFPRSLRRILIILRTTFFCLPSIVVAIGLIMAWGNSGIFTLTFERLGVDLPFSSMVYSPYAIVFANALMITPFCSTVIFSRLLEISEPQFKSAAIMGLRPLQTFRFLVWPAIRPSMAYFGGLTFLLSMGSFGALSVLGGGPKSRTVEMAIYQSVYYDADWELASILSLTHTLVCGALAFVLVSWNNRSLTIAAGNKGGPSDISILKEILTKFGHPFVFFVAVGNVLLDFLMLSPLTSIFVQTAGSFGLQSYSAETQAILDAASVSASLAIPAALVGTLSTWAISRAYCRYLSRGQSGPASILQMVSLIAAIVPPMAAAFGILVAQSYFEWDDLRYGATIGALVAMTSPFLLSSFLPGYGARLLASDRLRVSIGLSDFTFFKKVEWPAIGPTSLALFALCLSLCMNETALVTMLGDPTKPALTTIMMRMMNRYRFTDSTLVASVLIVLTFTVVFLFLKAENTKNA